MNVSPGKARRHGVNIQAGNDQVGELIWYSPAIHGRTADTTVGRTHRVVAPCEGLRIFVLASPTRPMPGLAETFQGRFECHLGRPSPRNSRPSTARTPDSASPSNPRPAQGLADLPHGTDVVLNAVRSVAGTVSIGGHVAMSWGSPKGLPSASTQACAPNGVVRNPLRQVGRCPRIRHSRAVVRERWRQ